MPIINYQRQFKNYYDKLMSDERISDKNKEYFVDFLSQLDANGSGPSTKSMYCNHVRKFLAKCPEDVTQLFNDKNAVNRLFSEIKNSTYIKAGETKTIAETTYNTIIKKSKTFVKWLNEDEAPKAFKTLKVKDCKRELRHSDMLTDDEIVKLIDSADDIQVKALISVAVDAPLRPGEIYDLLIGDISKGDHFFRLDVRKHKTKDRNMNLYHSVPELTAWLNAHPLKDDPTAPLWITRVGGNIRKPSYRSMLKRVDTVFRRAGINKPRDFYVLRHNANTRKKRDGVDVVIAARQSGHSVKMYTETYGRLAPEDEERILAKAYGIDMPDKLKPKVPIKCECGHMNSPGASFCTMCGEALSMNARLERDERRRKDLTKFVREAVRAEMMKDVRRVRK